MNDDILGGMWKQLKGQVKQQWGKLTDDDIDRISGKRDEVVGLVQERYGWDKAKAETEVDNFFKSHSQQND
ncbi:MAG: CsbD family protein [Candidatus Bipolaricaulis anaerobius]